MIIVLAGSVGLRPTRRCWSSSGPERPATGPSGQQPGRRPEPQPEPRGQRHRNRNRSLPHRSAAGAASEQVRHFTVKMALTRSARG